MRDSSDEDRRALFNSHARMCISFVWNCGPFSEQRNADDVYVYMYVCICMYMYIFARMFVRACLLRVPCSGWLKGKPPFWVKL